MIDTKKIIAIAEQELEGTDMFVVECNSLAGDEIELLIDSDSSISSENCTNLCRSIEGHFDRDVEDFALTVASSGIGNELKFLRQYKKLVGKSVEVLLKSGIKVLATLDGVTEADVTLSFEELQVVEGKKRKQMVTATQTYTFEEIKYTKEYLDFK